MKKSIVLLLLVVGMFSFISCGKKNSVESVQTEAPTVQQLVADNAATIVDVRDAEEFAEGHIPNSVNIPLDSIESSLAVFKQYENIVVVCRTGKRSTKAKEILEKNGFTNVYNGKAWDALNETLK